MFRLDEDAVDLVPHDRNRRQCGERRLWSKAGPLNAPRGGWVMLYRPGRLVVEGGNPAVGVGAERVLCARVRVSARVRHRRGGRLHDANVQALAVRLPHYLIERAVVLGVKRARGAVGGHAGVARGSVDVTGALRSKGGTLGSRPSACAMVNAAPIAPTPVPAYEQD